MLLDKRLALLVPVLALLACGGSVVKVGSGDGGGGDGSPDPACPAPGVVAGGSACGDPGLSCPAAIPLPSCNGSGGTTTVECTCESGAWSCPEVAGGIECPAPLPCPPASQVVQGQTCQADPGASCPADIVIQGCDGPIAGTTSCYCNGDYWDCASTPGPLCPADAGGGCPPPDTTFVGGACTYYGGNCGGDPQSCDGTTDYDALRCQGGVWVLLAATFCGAADGGSGGVDGGQGI